MVFCLTGGRDSIVAFLVICHKAHVPRLYTATQQPCWEARTGTAIFSRETSVQHSSLLGHAHISQASLPSKREHQMLVRTCVRLHLHNSDASV